jgi:sirohydrochlorin ferrochelatase
MLVSAPVAAENSSIGVLVLAHGGSQRWNAAVEQAVASANLPHPVRIAFGMGMHGNEVELLQAAVSALESEDVSRIVAIPFLVSSASEVMRQYEYLLGLQPRGPWEDHAKPVAVRVPITLTEPLNDDPVVAEVLLERAREVSTDPSAETVVLIAHGPNTDQDNARWIAAMDKLAHTIRQAGGFKEVVPATMRDDAEKSVLDAAIAGMRAAVEKADEQGTAIVVPVMIANGGVDEKIPPRLEGLDFVYQPKALLPHPALSAWIARRVEAAKAL